MRSPPPYPYPLPSLVCTHAQIQLETRFVGSTCLLTFNLLHFACDSFFSFILPTAFSSFLPPSSFLFPSWHSIVLCSLKFWATLFCSSLCERLNLILWISMHVLAVVIPPHPLPHSMFLPFPKSSRVLCLFKCCIIHWFLVAFVVFCVCVIAFLFGNLGAHCVWAMFGWMCTERNAA